MRHNLTRQPLLIATGNLGKQREYRALLADLPYALLFPQDVGLKLKVTEDGATYAQNAALKARAWAEATGWMVLADDTGLEVEELDGAPGLYSARYAPGPHPTDTDRRHYLLTNLAEHPRPWRARFVCVIAIATPQGVMHFAEGVCPGEIIPTERGAHGFGYDAIFLIPTLGRTMAELSSDEKNRLSHRAKAAAAIMPLLEILTQQFHQ